MATYTPVRLAGPAQLTTSATSVYTVGSGKSAVVKQIVFSNTTGSSTVVSAHVVPVGGSASAANGVVYNLSIGPNSQIIWSADIPMATGEQVYLTAGTGTAVTYIVSGIEIA